MGYSLKFKKLIKDIAKQKLLIEGSHAFNADFEKWEHMRRFIANAINKDGTILDIGCSNGFLLRCLQEWSKHKLIPYGIDRDLRLINQAKDLFPLYRDNFYVMDVRQLEDLAKFRFPAMFDFIYWNVWNNWEFFEPSEIKVLKKILKAVSDKGRLILGFYDGGKEEIIKKTNRLKTLGFEITGIMENPVTEGGGEMIAWVDKR